MKLSIELKDSGIILKLGEQEKRIIQAMLKNIISQKSKILNLYLPMWFVLIITIICIITGVFIGSRINHSDTSKNQEAHFSAVEEMTDTIPEKIDRTQWNLILVNRWNLLPEDYEPTVKYLNNGHAIDERAYDDLQDMLADCRAAGLSPVICSSYRTMEKQKELFSNKVNEYMAQGYSKNEAEKKAGELVAVPGTSEHQLGLALDIVDMSNQILNESQEDTAVQKWLMDNSWKYGFILRYPTDKSNTTGISYEPWHYRYVGKQAAKEIYDAQICLEEYLER